MSPKQPIFHGPWHEMKELIKITWNRLTEEDIKAIEDNHYTIYGRLRQHYSCSEDQAHLSVNDFIDR